MKCSRDTESLDPVSAAILQVAGTGTSIFDPVLCELVYRWFCPPQGRVLDPFAGGSVRGVVAAKLGRRYTGIELRPEQVAANREQAAKILGGTSCGDPSFVSDPDALTPVVEVAPGIWAKRDDLFVLNGSRGGKGRALAQIAARAKERGVGLITACSCHSPMASRVARACAAAGIPCRIHLAGSKSLTDQEADAEAMGAQLVKHKVNYLTALAAKARRDAERSRWELIAFGLESQEYFDQTRRQVANLPKDIKRIVTVAGSGMTMAAILAALDEAGRSDLPLLAVTIGHDPTPLLDRWAPSNWRSRVKLRPADTRYEQPAAVTTWHGIELDPYYEAKVAPFVTEGDLFWIVATRDIAQPDQALLTWIEGDAADASGLAAGEYDLVFTCPPYGNLEKYSDDPRDLSALPFEEMAEKYRAIIASACAMLRDDRFATIVVGDYRDPRGNYRNFVSLTIDAFLRAGLALYNEAILVTQVGSLSIRVRKQFEGARKLGKTHQNVVVFVKGDSR